MFETAEWKRGRAPKDRRPQHLGKIQTALLRSIAPVLTTCANSAPNRNRLTGCSRTVLDEHFRVDAVVAPPRIRSYHPPEHCAFPHGPFPLHHLPKDRRGYVPSSDQNQHQRGRLARVGDQPLDRGSHWMAADSGRRSEQVTAGKAIIHRFPSVLLSGLTMLSPRRSAYSIRATSIIAVTERRSASASCWAKARTSMSKRVVKGFFIIEIHGLAVCSLWVQYANARALHMHRLNGMLTPSRSA